MPECKFQNIIEKTKSLIPENISVQENEVNTIISINAEIGIKGIDISIDCSDNVIKIKGAREYKYPITEKDAEDFQEKMKDKYPGYSIYVSGQNLLFSKFFSYISDDEAIKEITNSYDIIKDAVIIFENDCVNFLEKEQEFVDSESDYNPEENISLVNVDNTFHAVSTTLQENEDYMNEQRKFTVKTFDELASFLGVASDGDIISCEDEESGGIIRCVLYEEDAEIMVSVAINVPRETGAMYSSFLSSNYPDLINMYNQKNERFIIKKFSTPDKYAPEETKNFLDNCRKALIACINEYKQILDKKETADFASDVNKILAEQTTAIEQREKEVSKREKDLLQREFELKKQKEELEENISKLEAENRKKEKELKQEKRRLEEYEETMNLKIKEYEDRNTRDILNMQNLANKVAILQNKQSAIGQGTDDELSEEVVRLRNKVQQITSQKIALEKKLNEKLANKEGKIRHMSEIISEKEDEIKKIEGNIDDIVKSKVTDIRKEIEDYVKNMESQIENIGHILEPEEMLEYYRMLNIENVKKLHAPNAEFVVYNDESLEIRIRFGDVNYIDVSRDAILKDQILRKLNSKHIDIKFFSKGDRIILRSYFKKNASVDEVDEIVESLTSHFAK